MPISLDLKPAIDKFYGRWVRKGRPEFMGSEAYEILTEALRRYLRQESSGLSFLIAGHRGAGKTALVAEVVEAISDELFERWDRWSDAVRTTPTLQPPRERQRPLLVKLHGPSLVEKELPSPGGGEEPKAKSAKAPVTEIKPIRRKVSGTTVEVNLHPSVAKSDSAEEAGSRTASTGRAQTALVQVMIGLYRALAREIGEAAAARALESQGGEDDEYRRELAAQLRLELDRTAGPEMLRDLWGEIEPDGYGLLWPRKISEALMRSSLVPDQHFREIIALATAAQAFQVCSGAVTYNQTRKESAAQERTVELAARFDLKDALSRLLTLGIGALIGYGVAGPIGAGIGLLGSMSVSTLSRRSSKRERSEDYTFIVDRSVQTLERDLPLVIERVRAAGLAPVFVVDELDKLPLTGDSSVADSIGEMIGRLKHLTTDYGFFCFLTGRDYFEKIDQKLAKHAYPVEHTFFSERLLISYGPANFTGYATEVLIADAPDLLARYLLAKSLILDSQLNTIEFRRRLSRGWDDLSGKRIYRQPSSNLTSSIAYLLAASLQLAIEFELEKPRAAARIGDDSGFKHMAFDVLYRVARLWGSNEDEIDMDRPVIARDLLSRLDDSADPPDPVTAATEAIGKADFDLLCTMTESLAANLCQFSAVFSKIADTGPPDSPYQNNKDIAAALRIRHIDGLLRSENTSRRYTYLFRRDGADRFESQQLGEIGDVVTVSRTAIELLGGFGIKLKDLQVIGWPSALSDETIETAMRTADEIIAGRDLEKARSAVIPLQEFKKELEKHKKPLGALITLSASIVRDAGLQSPSRFSDVMAILPWFLAEPARIFDGSADVPDDLAVELADAHDFPTLEEEGHVIAWRGLLRTREQDRPEIGLEDRAARAWTAWFRRIGHFFTPDLEAGGLLHYDDLVLAAAGRLPSRLLHRDLARVDAFAWTELGLAALAPYLRKNLKLLEHAPAWAGVAALRRLGFGLDTFEAIIARLGGNPALRVVSEAQQFLPGRAAEPAGGGTLVVASRPLATPPSGPYILVTPAGFEVYMDEIAWLQSIGAIKAGVYELD